MLTQLARPEAVELLTGAAQWCAYGWLCGHLYGRWRWGWAR